MRIHKSQGVGDGGGGLGGAWQGKAAVEEGIDLEHGSGIEHLQAPGRRSDGCSSRHLNADLQAEAPTPTTRINKA